MTAPSTFTGKNIETALQKASIATGVAADSLKYEILAGATGGYALIKVTGQAKAVVVPTGPLVESLSGDPSAPSAERSERPDRGDRGDRGGDRGDRRSGDRGGDRGPRPERSSDRVGDRSPRPERSSDRGGDRSPRPERTGDRPERTGDRGDRRGGDRGPRPERGGGDRRPRRDEELLPIPQDGPTAVEISVAPDAPLGPFGEKVREILEGVLTRMGFGMKIILSETADEVVADLQSGPYHDALLARELELLDAIEHLVEKAATGQNQVPEGTYRKKLHLDSQGHRAKADVDLAQAAKHMADRAIAEQRVMKLGPLDPRARRIVHLTLREMSGVVTKSEGEGVFRRVCIIPKAANGEAAGDEGGDDSES